MSDPDPVRWGFLGAGRIASRSTAPAVHSSRAATLQAVAARDIARAEALGPVSAYGSYQELIDDEAVEAVYINLSNEAHLPWAEAALRSGKHVLCEKPLGLSADQTRAMFAAASVSERLLVEALWYRWHPRTQAVEHLIRSGAIGDVLGVDTWFSFSGVSEGDFRLDPARGGGALWDLGCYCLSAVAAALGDVLPATTRSTADRGGTAVDLTTDAAFTFSSGAQATVHCSMAEPGRQSIVVTGSSGSIEVPKPAFSAGRDETARLVLRTPGSVREQSFEKVDAFELMVSQVSAAIRGRQGFLVGADHSLAIAAMSDEARSSWAATAHEPDVTSA